MVGPDVGDVAPVALEEFPCWKRREEQDVRVRSLHELGERAELIEVGWIVATDLVADLPRATQPAIDQIPN